MNFEMRVVSAVGLPALPQRAGLVRQRRPGPAGQGAHRDRAAGPGDHTRTRSTPTGRCGRRPSRRPTTEGDRCASRHGCSGSSAVCSSPSRSRTGCGPGSRTARVEVIGTTALILSGGLALIIGSYFWFVSRRIDPRPEDRLDADIAEGAGELGFFSPGSYWPISARVRRDDRRAGAGVHRVLAARARPRRRAVRRSAGCCSSTTPAATPRRPSRRGGAVPVPAT